MGANAQYRTPLLKTIVGVIVTAPVHFSILYISRRDVIFFSSTINIQVYWSQTVIWGKYGEESGTIFIKYLATIFLHT